MARACPTSDSNWQAATPLPPTPNGQLCSCMLANLTCVAQSSLSTDEVTKLFGQVCNPDLGENCAGFAADGSTGVYGAYAGCNATEQLSFAFNQYYLNQTANNPGNSQACDFGGSATTQSPVAATGACGALVSQAGTAGTGSVTSAPTGTGSGSSSSTTTHKGSAGMLTVPNFSFGMLQLGLYVTVAALVGAGMILL